jgi:monoamine oxidase
MPSAEGTSDVAAAYAGTGAGSGTIAVLGAGISGLVAAYELERLGHEVVLLEADARIGGRILTHRFAGPDGPLAELGAMRIPANHDLTLRYVEELGLRPRLRTFRNILTDPANYLSIGAGPVRVREAAEALVRDTRAYAGGGSPRRSTLLFLGWLHALVRALGPSELRQLVRGDLAKMVVFADDLELDPFLRDHGIDLGGAFLKYPELRAACSRRLASFLDDMVRESSGETLCLAGGMDQLPQGIAARLRRPVRTGHAVVAIDTGEDGVTVTFDHDGGRTHRTYPAVLCTIPFAVLRHLRLTGIDADKRDAIATLNYGSSTKVALHCRDAFWTRTGIAGGGSALGGSIRQTYYPAQEHDPALGAALLGSYTIAEDADVLGKLPEDERHRVVVEELTAAHPELAERGAIRDVVSQAWGESPWNRGCAARRWGFTGAELDHEVDRAVRPQGGLFFAGEHCSHTPAWINAGIETAIGAVSRIEALFQRTSVRQAM